MVNEIKAASRILKLRNHEFSIPDIYKRIKTKAEEMGYLVVEKEQTTKFTKYGQELKFDFYLDKEYDYFGKSEISLTVSFREVQKVKGIEKGEIKIEIIGKQVLDYKNRWANNSFNRFLFKIYLKIKKKEFLHKYTIKVGTEVSELYNYLKDGLEAYHP